MQRLQTLKGDLEDVGVGELGGVVDHIDPEQGDDRHGCDGVGIATVFFGFGWQITKTEMDAVEVVAVVLFCCKMGSVARNGVQVGQSRDGRGKKSMGGGRWAGKCLVAGHATQLCFWGSAKATQNKHKCWLPA